MRRSPAALPARGALLRLRFGDLPQAAVARVEEAKLAEIEQWGERVLTAASLDEVLGAS